jgi:hypothetical protein
MERGGRGAQHSLPTSVSLFYLTAKQKRRPFPGISSH